MDCPNSKTIKANLEILKDITVTCKNLDNIKPVVLFGTLLGFIRNGDLIEWNNDIELGIHHENWDENEILRMYSKLRQIGYIVTYYKVNKSISVRTLDKSGEVHINYFKEINKKSFRPLEPCLLKLTNVLSFLLYFFSLLITADIDKNDKHKVKYIFYVINKILHSKFRRALSLMFLKLSLMLTSCKGVYQFPFSLVSLRSTKIRDIDIFIPRNSKKIVESIYGKNWKTPQKNWSFYDPENKNFTEVKKINKKWNYNNDKNPFE